MWEGVYSPPSTGGMDAAGPAVRVGAVATTAKPQGGPPRGGGGCSRPEGRKAAARAGGPGEAGGPHVASRA